ncbi:hypothetical protein DL93DRAFT_776126 [Clavulina sp. PMI_390]|nr:hypothetical protein DL93DRAFT_776126 [Clavulina sp. PMI_390]
MIVPLELGSVKISILSGGEPFEEYNVRPVSDRHLECYIASEMDKPFVIKMRNCRPSPPALKVKQGHRFEVYLDGVDTRGKMLETTSKRATTHTGLRISQELIRPFTFGHLRLKEDDENEAPHAEALKDVGTIQVMITSVEVLEVLSSPSQRWGEKMLPGSEGVSEKAKKGGSHAIQLGNSQENKYTPGRKSKPLKHIPPYKVTFRYAPIEYLWAREIVPRPKSPSQASGQSHPTSRHLKTSAARTSVKRESTTVKQETDIGNRNHGGKRKSDVLDISSDDDALDEEDRVALARIKGKLSKKTKVKSEEKTTPAFTPGEVIVLSD